MLSIHKSDEPCHARALWAFPAPDLTELHPSIWRKSDSLNFGSWFLQLHFFHAWMVSQIFATMFIKITMLLKQWTCGKLFDTTANCDTLHPSQPTTALHPSEGRRTEGGKGPASRWRSAIQMFWLLLAAGGCITRWVPSDRTGRPRILQLGRLGKQSTLAGGSES